MVIDVAITKLSSKGQIVIPLKMWDNFSEGKNSSITFAKRIEKAIKRYEKGIYKEMDSEDFAEELENGDCCL